MEFSTTRWGDIILAVITSGGTVGFLWWLLQKTIETKLLKVQQRITQSMREEIRRTGKLFDDQYVALKEMISLASRLGYLVTILESDLNSDSSTKASMFEEIIECKDASKKLLLEQALILPMPIYESFIKYGLIVSKAVKDIKSGTHDNNSEEVSKKFGLLQSECHGFLGIPEWTLGKSE